MMLSFFSISSLHPPPNYYIKHNVSHTITTILVWQPIFLLSLNFFLFQVQFLALIKFLSMIRKDRCNAGPHFPTSEVFLVW